MRLYFISLIGNLLLRSLLDSFVVLLVFNRMISYGVSFGGRAADCRCCLPISRLVMHVGKLLSVSVVIWIKPMVITISTCFAWQYVHSPTLMDCVVLPFDWVTDVSALCRQLC